jgi:hypothetical protein
MKTIMKTLFVSIASLSLMFSVNAGELTVSGTAKATYHITNGQQSDNTIGITNELNFKASGEMDNGFGWAYNMALDPTTASSAATTDIAAGSALNDDTSIVVTMNDLGTAKICVSTCGNSKEYAFDQSAYTSMSDTGLSEGIEYPISASSYASLQYHTPELPFGTTASYAYGQSKADGQSGNAQRGSNGNNISAYSVVTKPVDGLTLSGSYYQIEDYDDGITTELQTEDGGAWGATYAMGNFTVGYGKSYKSPESTTAITGTAGGAVVEYYENTGISVGFAVNDALSVSYTTEESSAVQRTGTNTVYDIEMNSIQAAYSLGGATLSLARADYDNIGYADGVDASDTIIAINFAF